MEILLMLDPADQPAGHLRTTGIHLIPNPSRTLLRLREGDTRGMNPTGITK